MQQSKLPELNANMDKLQTLAGQLDPMEAAYAEVRFLDVDFEQLEKQLEEVLSQMRAEMDHEKVISNAIGQLDREAAELAAQIASLEATTTTPTAEEEKLLQCIQQTTVPALRAKLAELKEGDQLANNTRKHVQRQQQQMGTPQPLDQIEQGIGSAEARAHQLAHKIEEQQQKQRADAVVKKIRSVLVEAAKKIPEEEQILECSKELEQLLADPRSEELCRQVEELKRKKERKDALQAKIDERVRAIGPKLEELSDKFAVMEKEQQQQEQPKQGKKRDKSKIIVGNRDDRIQELKKGIELLECDVLPAFDGTFERQALQEGIPIEPSTAQLEQQAKAMELVQALKVEGNNFGMC